MKVLTGWLAAGWLAAGWNRESEKGRKKEKQNEELREKNELSGLNFQNQELSTELFLHEGTFFNFLETQDLFFPPML